MSIAKTNYEIKLAEFELEDGSKIMGCPKEIQLLRTGKFDHFFFGKFKITKENLAEMKKNFDNRVRKVDLAIDIAHQNHLDAAGWVENLRLENDGNELWAEIQWTELGCEKIEKKLFRYLSAEFDTEYKDNETGKKHGYVLLGAGLTNRPFVKGMQATTELTEEKVMEEKLQELEASNVQLAEENKNLTESNTELSEKNENLEKEISELKDKIALSEKEAEFNKMLEEGKVVPAQKEAWLKGNLAEFAEKASKIELNLNEKGSGENTEEVKKTQEDLFKAAKELNEKENISIDKAMSKLLASAEFKHLN